MYELLILGALLVQDRTGYKLREMLGSMLEPQRKISNGVIYPVLHKMAVAGYITLEETAESGRKQKLAHILPAGEQRFNELMTAPVPLDAKREETYRFKFHNLYRVKPVQQQAILHAYRVACQQDLESSRALDRHLQRLSESADRPDTDWIRRTIRLQMAVSQSKIDWADQQLAAINQDKEVN
ncbi:PadR family transcriptional regulator [Lacticaseibacillus zhaodongensis]|uniref:PadR family transcriptional regulator n=1 Tax=Lacticaseibacillus zhaodongensis TaxID=2668065 RepID=UPI0018AFC617|nr:PadR family transcriptional regulator [Lacticaseibacillus zhaodongensis]